MIMKITCLESFDCSLLKVFHGLHRRRDQLAQWQPAECPSISPGFDFHCWLGYTGPGVDVDSCFILCNKRTSPHYCVVSHVHWALACVKVTSNAVNHPCRSSLIRYSGLCPLYKVLVLSDSRVSPSILLHWSCDDLHQPVSRNIAYQLCSPSQ